MKFSKPESNPFGEENTTKRLEESIPRKGRTWVTKQSEERSKLIVGEGVMLEDIIHYQ
jgi:hypothetical protein